MSTTHMFRFSVDEETARHANEKQLASNNVTADEDWEAGLRDTDDFVPGERCFRAENETPNSVDNAVEFVRGLFLATPDRVWIGDELHKIEGTEEETS